MPLRALSYQLSPNIAIMYTVCMTALIIDTSGMEGVVALAFEGEVIQTFSLPPGRELSKVFFKSIQSITNKKIDFIALGKGPGTFTGTRVGGMAAQALSYGWDIPIVCFSSSLLPNLPEIAASTYRSFLAGEAETQIDLVYISPSE